MIIHDQVAYNKVVKHSKKHPAGNYTQFTKAKGHGEIAYMSEVSPHYDVFSGNEKTWKVIFLAVAKGYYFIYRLNGVLHKIIPEKNVVYEFEFKKYHAFLHEDNLVHFNKKNYWKTWEEEKEVKCIFKFVD